LIVGFEDAADLFELGGEEDAPPLSLITRLDNIYSPISLLLHLFFQLCKLEGGDPRLREEGEVGGVEFSFLF